MGTYLNRETLRGWLPYGADPAPSILDETIEDVEGRIYLRVGKLRDDSPVRGALTGIARDMALGILGRFIFKSQPQRLRTAQELYDAAKTRLDEFDAETDLPEEGEESLTAHSTGVSNIWDSSEPDDLFPEPYPHYRGLRW